MKISIEMDLMPGNLARFRVSADGRKKFIRYSYPNEVNVHKVRPDAFSFLPLNLLIYLLPANLPHYDVTIRGVPLTVDDLMYYGWVLRERYTAQWAGWFRSLGLPFVLPKFTFRVEKVDAHPRWQPAKNVGYTFSMGKESQLVRSLAPILYPDHVPIAAFQREPKAYAVPMESQYHKYPELRVVDSDEQYMMPWSWDLQPGMRGFAEKRVDTPVMPILLPIAEALETSVWMMGSEFDATYRFELENGERYYHVTDFDSLYYEWVNRYFLSTLFTDSTFFSPIGTICEPKILHVLKELFRPAFDELYPCWLFGMVKNESVPGRWCGKCGKCYHYFYMYVCLGLKPPFRMERPWHSYKGGKYPDPGEFSEWNLVCDTTERMYTSRLQWVPEQHRETLKGIFGPFVEPWAEDPRPIHMADFNLGLGAALLEDAEAL